MTTPLTREQVLQLKPLLDPTIPSVKVFGGWAGIYTAFSLMIDTDAALRQELVVVNLHLDAQKESVLNCAKKVGDLRAQLAAMTQERDRYKHIIGGIPILEEQLAARTQERDDEKEVRNCVARNSALLEQQLATAQARVTRLEGALKYLGQELNAGALTLYNQKAILKCDRDWLLSQAGKAQQALREEGEDE